PWVECASAARCFGIPYRGRETVFLPAPGLYQLGVRATDDDGNVVTEVVSLSFAAPVDVWVMGMEWNQAVQDVVYTHLDRAVGSPGSKTVRAGTSRVPLVQGKAVAVRVYLGLRRPALVRVSAAGLPASGRLTVTVTHGSETSTTTLSPVTNPSCANHLGEDPGSGCTGRVMVPLSFGHPSHPTSLDRILVDPFYDVELAAASDFDLDLVWRRLQPERTLNFVVPPELVSSIQPGDRVELRADVEPLGLAEATAGDNRFTLAVEDIAPPADLDLRVVNVDMPDAPGGAGAAATEAQVGAALDGFMHLVPYSGLAEETATPFSYDGHFKRLRVHVLGIEVADLFIDQCPTLWLELLMAFGLDRERTTLGLTPPQIELLQHPSNGGEPDCKGMGWRLPGEDGSYVGGVAHTVTPSNLGTIGTTAGAFAPADVGATDFWDLVAVGAQELYHAHLDRRHVGDFHDERSGCFVDDDRFVEMAAAFLLDWDVDSDCTKPAPHQHGTMGEYPSAVEPLRGDIGAMGLRIEEAGSDWNLTLYDPCPMPLGIRIDPRDSIPWINERWSVFSPAHDCRRRDRDRSHDFLSYGEHRWTSVEQFSPLNIGNPGPNPRVLPAVNALRASSHGSPEPTVGAGLELDENPPFRLWGVITADGGAGIGEAIPVGSMSSTPLAGEGDPSGVHLQVTRTDGSSSNLAPFPSVQSAHGGDVHAIFLAELPPGPPPQRVALMVGGETWTSVEASASAPTVNLLEPNGGDEWTGGQPRTIRWEGEDADSDALSYRVEYSADGGATWTPIGVSRSATSIEVAGDQLPAGDRAIVRVVASDGLRFAADVSDGTFCNQVQGDCASMPVDGDAAPVGLEAGGLAVLVVAVLGAGAGAIIWRRRRAAAST
ncbi:MAG: hypothetical protein ACRDHD_10940, partial [Candidatus Limnocylindria bacterium]